MEEKTPLEKQLLEMLDTANYSAIGSLRETATWAPMNRRERSLLALLLIEEGEQLLKGGNSQAIDNFSLASQIASHDAYIFYRQAMAYATQDQNMRFLMAACNALETALELNPAYYEGWCAWGCVLARMGVLQQDSSYFQEAEAKFADAATRLDKESPFLEAELYWQWGLCWFYLGKHSGELHDFHCAMTKYRMAAERGLNVPEFWSDYGDALLELANLSGKNALFFEAVSLYRNVVHLNPRHIMGWFKLGYCSQRIFAFTKEEAYFQLADESFARVAELNPEMAPLWLHWGQLYVDFGRSRNDTDRLQASLEKFVKADSCEPNDAAILCFWAEAQLWCGVFLERLEFLKEAEAKVLRSLELHRDSVDAWYIYGTCLTELGKYFSSEKYYEEAIEKFRYGLSLHPKHPMLWYGLALAHFAIGELREDVSMFEKAAHFCGKAVEAGGNNPQFLNDWGVTLMQLAEITQERHYIEAAIEKLEIILGRTERALSHACDIEWLYNYGCALDLLGSFTEDATDHERAIQVLTLALQQNPGYTAARYSLASAFMHLGELTDDIDHFQQALGHFQLVLEEDPEDEFAWNDTGLVLLNLTTLMHDPLQSQYTDELYEQAEDKLYHAVALGCTGAFYNLACLYSLRKNVHAAMHFIERAEACDSLPGVDELLHDEWLVHLRDAPEFRNFISLLLSKRDSDGLTV